MAAGDGLARVTYLPGVQPSPPPAAAPEGELPTFTTFFGAVDDAHDEPKALEASDPSETPAKRDALGREKREVRAENVSMHALTRRGMSRWELEKTLTSREFDDDVIAEELERLERVGLIDDAALAYTLVRTQHERKGLGRSALTAELRRRHIPQEAIDAAMEQVDDDDEQSKATELALKRAPQLHSFDLETAKRRLTAFLMRKGYSSSIVRSAVDEALAERTSAGRDRSGTVRFR
jgi:regulatory protein